MIAQATEQLRGEADRENSLERVARVTEDVLAAGCTVPCPHCQTATVKDNACMHMDNCPCGGSFCYCCGPS